VYLGVPYAFNDIRLMKKFCGGQLTFIAWQNELSVVALSFLWLIWQVDYSGFMTINSVITSLMRVVNG
jgi:hypothetical protein